MNSFRDMPIQRKMTLIILLSSAAALLLASFIVLSFQWMHSRKTIRTDLDSLVEIVAANSTAAVAFGDQKSASELLASLKFKPHFVSASLYNPDGTLFAHTGREEDRNDIAKEEMANVFKREGPVLLRFQPVFLGDRNIGSLCLRFNSARMKQEMIEPYLITFGIALVLSLLLAVILSTRFQRLISAPILQLAVTAKAVADNQDYSLRAKSENRDELGSLTNAFNHMLARIEEQAAAIRTSEGRYRLLFERNPMPIFVYDAETLVHLAVNEVALSHYGYSREELLVMTAADLSPGEDVARQQALFKTEKNKPVSFHICRHKKKDGSVIDVEVTTHLIEYLGQPARLVLAMDVTQRNLARLELEHRLLVEKLISEISTKFINLAPEEIDAGIDQALGVISRFAGADRCVLTRFTDNNTRTLTNIWCNETVTERLPKGHCMPLDLMPWWMERLQWWDTVCIPRLEDLPAEASAEKTFFSQLGVKSMLGVPMYLRGTLIGFLGFDSVREYKSWGDDEATLLRLAAQIFINAQERQRANTQLESLHNQMLQVSRSAGMAEVATGVLHNVGNVLNSVNISANLVADRIRRSRIGKIAEVAELLVKREDIGTFLTEDASGKKVPAYLQKLAAHLHEEQGQMIAELGQLAKNIDHIKQIVSMQQSYAQVAGVIEVHTPESLVEDSLRITEPGLMRTHINIVRRFESAPTVTVDKHKVLQILINLIRNARQAIEAFDGPERVVEVRISPNGGEHVRIQVQDTGEGIAEENLTRIFSHGFTTKQDGHGFGLHMSALAAKEMNGKLSVESKGKGHGATFTLELPIRHERN
jgi:PAS domain S-box-containing protein